MTPQKIIQRALELLKKSGWRKSIYRVDKNYYSHTVPCVTCNTLLTIQGITVCDAMYSGFNYYLQAEFAKSQRNSPLQTFGDLCQDKDKLHSNAIACEQPLYEAKCLIARMDDTIRVKDVSEDRAFLYPTYVDLLEWNDRQDQTEKHIVQTLELAFAGNYPPHETEKAKRT
jgi:hypothetical protein